MKLEIHEVKHFYKGFIPEFSVNTLARDELIAEKMAATIGRNKPRDHYDLYKIISYKIPIDLNLVKQKCKDSEDEFDITKIFNRANKLKRRWDEDVLQLLPSGGATFTEVMQTLSKHFDLKKEKDKKKEK